LAGEKGVKKISILHHFIQSRSTWFDQVSVTSLTG